MAKLPLATIREVLNIVDSGGNVPEAMRRRSFSMQKSPNGWRIHKESGAYRMALRAMAEIAQENLSPPSNHLARPAS